MQLAYWMYAAPAHIGTLRVASSFKNVHAIMHAPLGDDYFNVMRSMLERERDFTPVTASIVDRHVLSQGSQEKVVGTIVRKDREEVPDLLVVTPTCTSSILQEDLENFVGRASLEAKGEVILSDINHYRVNEFQAGDRSLQQIVQHFIEKAIREGDLATEKTAEPSVNLLGFVTLGFHHQHDRRELKRLLRLIGVQVNEILPETGSVERIKNLPKAWFNWVPYREGGIMAARYLEEVCGMPYVAKTPMGVIQTGETILEIANVIRAQRPGWGESLEAFVDYHSRYISQAAWFSRSIDCQNLTGKKAVVFGDASHAAAMTRILSQEMGIRVSCAGTYCTHDADWFRDQVQLYCDEVLITENHTEVGDLVARIEPAAIFGTQMERHLGKRLGIPCGVISAPVHIQNFPLGFRPYLGYEGTNQIADLVYNSFTLGMEDHLLEVFGGHDTKEVITKSLSTDQGLQWSPEALEELQKIPGFVRSKVKRNTEKFARNNNLAIITVESMYSAKEMAQDL